MSNRLDASEQTRKNTRLPCSARSCSLIIVSFSVSCCCFSASVDCLSRSKAVNVSCLARSNEACKSCFSRSKVMMRSRASFSKAAMRSCWRNSSACKRSCLLASRLFRRDYATGKAHTTADLASGLLPEPSSNVVSLRLYWQINVQSDTVLVHTTQYIEGEENTTAVG